MSASTHQSDDLRGQVAIVTGGTRGIGWAICEALYRRGAKVLACGSTAESVAAAAVTASADMPELEVMQADARSEHDLRGLVDRAHELAGRLTCLVSCAGQAWRGDAIETSPEEWDRCLDLNLKAGFLAAHVVLPHIQNVPNANLTFVSSIWAITATRRRLAYSVAKTGLAALARNLAIDHGPKGVRVNAVAPGYIETDLLRRSLQELSPGRDVMPDIIAAHPLKRIGTPRDVGEAVGFLASPGAGFITGQLIVIDGGATAQFGLAEFWG